MLNWEALWRAPDNQSFYAWGGAVSRFQANTDERNRPNGLWQFKSNSWSQVPLNSGSGFPSLSRPAGGMSAFGNGWAYYLGGYNAEVNTSSNGPFTPENGLIKYNMTSNTWSNATALGYDYDGTAFFGGLHYIPTFGSEGLLIAFGGEISSPTTWSDDGVNFQVFSNVSIYDPAGLGKWYSQQATGYSGSGDIPVTSDMFCVIGAQGNGNTYEM